MSTGPNSLLPGLHAAQRHSPSRKTVNSIQIAPAGSGSGARCAVIISGRPRGAPATPAVDGVAGALKVGPIFDCLSSRRAPTPPTPTPSHQTSPAPSRWRRGGLVGRWAWRAASGATTAVELSRRPTTHSPRRVSTTSGGGRRRPRPPF